MMPKDALLIIPGKGAKHGMGDMGDMKGPKDGGMAAKASRAAKAAFEALKADDEEAFVDALKGAIEYCSMAREEDEEGEGY
jgi:hypothetical protein